LNPPKVDVECGALYVPSARGFPLVDAFFFVDAPRKTAVGLQTTVRGSHHSQPGTVRRLSECMAQCFNGWEAFAADLSWEIIYVRHGGSAPTNAWEERDAVAGENEDRREEQRRREGDEEEKTASPREEEAHQYQVRVSEEDFVPRKSRPKRAAAGEGQPTK
ncbi:retrotransposon hot spot (RHS) protein, partial [Trypanosoma conorhini]